MNKPMKKVLLLSHPRSLSSYCCQILRHYQQKLYDPTMPTIKANEKMDMEFLNIYHNVNRFDKHAAELFGKRDWANVNTYTLLLDELMNKGNRDFAYWQIKYMPVAFDTLSARHLKQYNNPSYADEYLAVIGVYRRAIHKTYMSDIKTHILGEFITEDKPLTVDYTQADDSVKQDIANRVVSYYYDFIMKTTELHKLGILDGLFEYNDFVLNEHYKNVLMLTGHKMDHVNGENYFDDYPDYTQPVSTEDEYDNAFYNIQGYRRALNTALEDYNLTVTYDYNVNDLLGFHTR